MDQPTAVERPSVETLIARLHTCVAAAETTIDEMHDRKLTGGEYRAVVARLGLYKQCLSALSALRAEQDSLQSKLAEEQRATQYTYRAGYEHGKADAAATLERLEGEQDRLKEALATIRKTFEDGNLWRELSYKDEDDGLLKCASCDALWGLQYGHRERCSFAPFLAALSTPRTDPHVRP